LGGTALPFYDNRFQDAVWGGASGSEKFVAVGGWEKTGAGAFKTGKIAYSSDGVTWTAVSGPLPGEILRGVAWGGGKFVAVGGNNTMVSSTDGETWASVIFTGHLSDIAWGGTSGSEKFVAVGSGGTIVYSSDGATWTPVADSKFGSSLINAIAWGNGKWFAAGEEGKMASSTDGIIWTLVNNTTFGSSDHIYGISCGAGKWVAVGLGSGIVGGKIAYSSDGVTWTAVSSINHPFFATNSSIQSAAWGAGKWVVGGGIANTGARLAYSVNGTSWTTAGHFFGLSLFSVYGTAWGGPAGGKRFIAVGGGSTGNYARIWYSNIQE
jgi:hypothetical protein